MATQNFRLTAARRRQIFQVAAVFAVSAGLLLQLSLVLAEPRKSSKDKKEEDPDKITLKLRADVQAGFAPLEIVFTGRIKNLNLDDEQFCHAGTFLMRKLVTGEFQTVAGQDPACRHAPEKRDISPTFSHSYVLWNAGTYEFFAMVVTHDGQRITSNSIPVRVLSSPGGN